MIGRTLAHYHLTAAIGAGGMGEVYRATDTRLGRDVAIKVLPKAFAADPDRLARFEREARVLASLNHSGIAHLYGFEKATLPDGTETHFLAMELVEGEDLAERLKRGPVPVDEALPIARQVADALEEAHEKGIVHRDLKPANVKVTPDGKVKVLDFGLAKAFAGDGPGATSSADLSQSPTLAQAGTAAGIILGTAAYMSPEQARGKAVDRKADIWALGVVLWEMLTGRRLFTGETVSDVLAAVLTREPEWAALPPQTPWRVRELLRRCLERNPRQRLHDAADARLAIEDALAGRADGPPAEPSGKRAPRGRRVFLWAIPLALAAGAALGALAARSARPVAKPVTFERLTFRPGHFANARFAPDGQTVFYSASWDGNPRELYQSRPRAGELALDLQGANLLSVSRHGELALLLPKLLAVPYFQTGTLAVVSASGGTPRELADGVVNADWAPDGQTLAVVRDLGGRFCLEFPLGERRYEAPGHLYFPRVSPDGERVALFERDDDGLSLLVFDRTGRRTVLSAGWGDWWNLAWAPGGREIWFGAAKAGAAAALYAVDLEGRLRDLWSAPGTLEIHDVAADGRALVARVATRTHVFGRAAGKAERKLSWLETTTVADLSADGRRLLLRENSEREGGRSGVFLRDTDGAPPVRLGDGRAEQLSPDGRWALALRGSDVVALPTGPGTPRSRDTGLASLAATRWMPDGRQVLVAGRVPGGRTRLYALDLEGDAPPRPIGDEFDPRFESSPWQHVPLVLSRDGRRVAIGLAGGGVRLVPLDGSKASDVPGAGPNERPLVWTADPSRLYVLDPTEIPARVFVVDVTSGRRQLVHEIHARDSSGVYAIENVALTPDGAAYAYDYQQFQSDLYVVDGLR
jgi:hypothetical protein